MSGISHYLLIACVLSCAVSIRAHDTPAQLPPSQSAAEAWNVIEQSKANIDQLLDTNLTRDVAAQLANISGALRSLHDQFPAEHSKEKTSTLANQLLTDEIQLLQNSRDAQDPRGKTIPAWRGWCKALAELESLYPAQTVHAEIYICPMHPLDRHVKADEKCSVCSMALVRRRLPASGVYQKPGEPTLKLTAICPSLVVDRPATIVLHLTKPDGSPVRPEDLIETHTKKIHLLINDRSLADYHHEHPEPTATPGEYRFTFIPHRPGPYRIWADVVPAASGIQEYVITDLPAATAPQPIADRQTQLTATLDGRRYDLAFDSAGQPLHAGRTILGTISITTADGKPFTQLEPVMGAFAHLVGFSEDGKSVLHIHPYGKEPTAPTDRAGPAFAFKFYAPAAGFLRLYCQVHVNGADVFVPFNLTILPAVEK